jgi:hypothetical protein
MYAADRDFPFASINYCTSILGMTGTFVFIAMATPLLAFVLPVLAVGGAYFLRFYLATSKVCAVPLSDSAERAPTIFSNSEDSNSDPNLRFVSLNQAHEIFSDMAISCTPYSGPQFLDS